MHARDLVHSLLLHASCASKWKASGAGKPSPGQAEDTVGIAILNKTRQVVFMLKLAFKTLECQRVEASDGDMDKCSCTDKKCSCLVSLAVGALAQPHGQAQMPQ